MGCPDAVAHSAPVDLFKLADACLRHPAGQPGDLIIEVFREPAGAVCPGDILCKYAMFPAFDPVRPVADVHRDTVEIRSTP